MTFEPRWGKKTNNSCDLQLDKNMNLKDIIKIIEHPDDFEIKILELYNIMGQDVFTKLTNVTPYYELNYVVYKIMEVLIDNDKYFELTYKMVKLVLDLNDTHILFIYVSRFGFKGITEYNAFFSILHKITESYVGTSLYNMGDSIPEAVKYMFTNGNPEHIKKFVHEQKHSVGGIHIMVSYNNELFDLMLNIGVTIPVHYDKELRRYDFCYKTKLALRTVIDHSHIARDKFHIQSNVRRGTEIKEIRRFCYLPPTKKGEFITVLRNITFVDFKYLLDYKLIKHAAVEYPQAYRLRGSMTQNELRIKMWKKGFSYIFIHDENFAIISNIILPFFSIKI